MTQLDFLKQLQAQHNNNSLVKIAIANNRDYVTPEDIDEALKVTDVNILRKDALELLGDDTGYGVEDRKLFAQLAAQAKSPTPIIKIDMKVNFNYPESWDYWVSEIKENEVLIRTTESVDDPMYDDFWIDISEIVIP